MLLTLVGPFYDPPNPLLEIIGFILIIVVIIFIIRQWKSKGSSNLESSLDYENYETDVLGLPKKQLNFEHNKQNSIPKHENWPIIVFGLLLIFGIAIISRNSPNYESQSYQHIQYQVRYYNNTSNWDYRTIHFYWYSNSELNNKDPLISNKNNNKADSIGYNRIIGIWDFSDVD